MARLPTTIETGTPQGERPSLAVAQPTDFGLDSLAKATEAWGKVQAEDDDRKADELLREHVAGFETDFAGRAQTDEAGRPEFSSETLARLDTAFQPLLEGEQPSGVRRALRRRYDDYRAKTGWRAVGVQAERRRGVVAAQEQAVAAQAEGGVLQSFAQIWGAKEKALSEAYDGSQGDFAKSLMTGYEASRAELEASEAFKALKPESQAAVRSKLAADAVQTQTAALVAEDKGRTAFLIKGATEAADAVVNNIRTHPLAFATVDRDLDRALVGLPASVAVKARGQYLEQAAVARISALADDGDLAEAMGELESGRYDRVLDPAVKDRLIGNLRQDAARTAQGLMQAIELGEEVDEAALAQAAALTGDAGVQAKAAYRIQVGAFDPSDLDALRGGGPAGFERAFALTYQDEGGDQIVADDNGRGRSRGGINEAANPDLFKDGRTPTPAEQKARYRSHYWREIGGDRLPPGLATVAFDAAVLHGTDDAKRWLAQSDGDVARFTALQRAYMHKLAKDNPAKYGDDLKGWLARVGRREAEAARLDRLAGMSEDIKGDPIKFAMGTDKRPPLASIAPLPAPGAPGLEKALAQRARVADTLSRQYGAPKRLLSDAEAMEWRERIETDPMAGVQFAQATLAAGLDGPSAARVMAEVGAKGEASVQVHIAGLAANGSPRFAQAAARGLGLKAKGAKLDKKVEDEIGAEVKSVLPALDGMPELPLLVRATAEAAALAQGEAGGGLSPQALVRSALGASQRNGRVYGGPAEVNGRMTILPSWLDGEYADDVLAHLGRGLEAGGRGPVFTNGKPMPAASIARAGLRLMPTGRYRLVDRRGAALMTREGRPFELDLDNARDGLRRTFGREVVQ